MKFIYRLLAYLNATEPCDNDPLAHMSLRERADVPPWHEPVPEPCCQCITGVREVGDKQSQNDITQTVSKIRSSLFAHMGVKNQHKVR